MSIDRTLPYKLLEDTVGLKIKVVTNDYQEIPIPNGDANSFHKIIFHIEEDDPDVSAIGILFTLSLISFTFAAPRGYSENEFIPDEQWKVGYFLQGLEFEDGHLKYYGDYVSGRMMKTTIIYKSGGFVTLSTVNRGKSADRWISLLRGEPHIRTVK